MNWQEEKKRQRQGSRFWVGVLILAFFFLVLSIGLLQKIPWGEAKLFFSKIKLRDDIQSEKYPLAPIPENDSTSALLALMQAKNITISETPVASGSTLVTRLQDGTSVIFSTDQDIVKQVSSLQIILSRLTIEGKKATKIDFRYETPIIVYDSNGKRN